MNLIVGKQPLDAGKAEMLDIISYKTGLKSTDITLLIDAFSFFIRKRTIEYGSTNIMGVGKFYVKPYSYSLYGRKYHLIDFYPVDDLRERVRGVLTTPVKFCAPLFEQLKVVSKMFGLKNTDTRMLYKLWLTTISEIIRKYKEYRIPRIGIIKVQETKAQTGIVKKLNYDKPMFIFDFVLADPFFRELNKQTKQYAVYERLQQMLYLVGESREVSRKEYDKNHDYKKDKGR